MKKIIVAAIAALFTLATYAKGEFKIYEAKNFKLHVYYTNDVMDDASFIVETKNYLVTLEEPLFKVNEAEFTEYLNKLNKPVVYHIIDYHEGGISTNATVRVEGMAKFMTSGIYDAMMKRFQKNFVDKMSARPTGTITEIKFGDKITVDGVDFVFNRGSESDFPAAAILIGGKYYLNHWAPAKSHMKSLQLANKTAVDAEIVACRAALKSGAMEFLGSHGGLATKDDMIFKLSYLKTIKKLLVNNPKADVFVTELKDSYPKLAGEDGLEVLAKNLCK